MITYTIKYRKTGCFFWTTLKNVEGDSLNENKTRLAFFQEDGTKTEIPLDGMEVVFSKERFKMIKLQAEMETGQKVVVK